MDNLSLVVITNNSEKTLEACLKSAGGLVSEIILVDDYSSDGTVEIANRYQARVITRKLESCARQKQFGLEQASKEWVFLLDSDEACSEELAGEIGGILAKDSALPAYKLPRRNIYFGRWLKHGGKYPDYQVRLFKKNQVRYSDHFSHEKVIVDGKTGKLKKWILHYAYPDVETWLMKLSRTAEFDAMEMERKGVKPSFLNYIRLCIFRPFWRFTRRFIFMGAFLDGLPGLLACLHDVLTQNLAYFYLSQKTQAPDAPTSDGP